MSGCKIGKVKLKNGAEVLRFPVAPRDNIQKSLTNMTAHMVTSYKPGEIEGYILIAWGSGSTMSTVNITRPNMVHISKAPSFAEEETRRALFRQGDY